MQHTLTFLEQRKRKDDAPAETTTRATRRSTRNKAAEDAEIESTASGTTNTTVVAPAEVCFSVFRRLITSLMFRAAPAGQKDSQGPSEGR